MSDMLTFEVDLNMLRGDRVRSHVEFMHGAVSRMRAPEKGELVWAIDEDDARYYATLEGVSESGFVDLRLDLASRVRTKLEPLPTSSYESVPPSAQASTVSAEVDFDYSGPLGGPMTPTTWNPAGNAKVRLASDEEREEREERVSLAPLDPETALRALLATPPEKDRRGGDHN